MHQNMKQAEQADEEKRIAILDRLGAALAAKRKDAVSARAASGIEEEWLGDEEFYQGYDDANRNEFLKTASKPTASGGTSEPPKVTGSTVFPNITQHYVDAAAARVGDMLLPTDDRNFAIEATPIPDLFEELGEPPADVLKEESGEPMVEMPGGEVMPVSKAKDSFEKEKATAVKKAEKAQTRIDDWLTEGQYHAELRKLIDDCAKLGSGVIKGPVPVNRKSRKWEKNDLGIHVLKAIEEIKPGSRRIDPWNLFPDGACGESIHNGSGMFERDHLTAKKLAELKGTPGYISKQIERCIEEGPARQMEGDRRHQSAQASKDQFEIWYYHGDITKEELLAAGCECEGSKESYPAMLTMVNDRVIGAALNPLDSGEFPYDVIPWKRRPGMPWGMGVARQIRTPQRIVVAATRNLMDNAGLASGPQIVIRRGVEPENGDWVIEPLKMWLEGEQSDGQAGAPFLSVTIPMLEDSLMKIINMGMKMAEDVTGLPMLLQGQQGSAPDTVGGMTILNNNANAVLRRVARLFDSCITEPHIRRYYAWLMEYGEDENEKGDFQIVARGSSALVERDLQSQEMINVINLCLNPAFKKNPAKAMDEYLKSRRFDPAAFDYTDEELEELSKQQAPEDPVITAAKIREEGAIKRHEMQLGAQAQENQLDRELKQMEMDIDAQLASEELSSEERRHLEDKKVMLAELTIKIRAQERLSIGDRAVQREAVAAKSPQVAPAAVEPVGRAQPGRAFQQ